MTRVSVFTPTGQSSKIPYLIQAYLALDAQTMTEWEWWVLDNNEEPLLEVVGMAERDERVIHVHDNDFDRSQVHVMPYLLNKYYPRANGDLIFYLSDDDLIIPGTFRTFVDFFDSFPDVGAAYVSLGHARVNSHEDPIVFSGGITTTQIRSSGQVDCQIDGGQIMHHKSCLDLLEKPWFPESASDESARHCDGQFMEKLAQHYPLYPIGNPSYYYVTHRFTPVSHFTPHHGPNGKIGV